VRAHAFSVFHTYRVGPGRRVVGQAAPARVHRLLGSSIGDELTHPTGREVGPPASRTVRPKSPPTLNLGTIVKLEAEAHPTGAQKLMAPMTPVMRRHVAELAAGIIRELEG
jgi:hypothetical protein